MNVSQLLLAGLGTVREFDFSEPLADASGDLHLRGPLSGHVRLTRTPDGILVHSEHAGTVVLECARCLEDAPMSVEGVFDEEFVPAIDVRTGLPLHVHGQDYEQLLIDEHHVLDLDEILRQSVLTNLPLRPLCSPACPGLCTSCGQRLDGPHQPHPEMTQPDDNDASVPAAGPFARLAVLLRADQER